MADRRHGRSDIRVVGRYDVVDQAIERPFGHVGFGIGHRREGLERPDDVGRVGRGSPARFIERTASAAAEINTELLEYGGRSEIGRNNLTDRVRSQSFAHEVLRSTLSVATPPRGRYDA